MPIDAMITAAIIELLERSIEIRTIQELTKAVSNSLGARVTTRQVMNALKRNRHRITFEFGRFDSYRITNSAGQSGEFPVITANA